MGYILAIDPGNVKSAYVVVNKELKPIRFEIVDNEQLLSLIYEKIFINCNEFVIEMIAHYGKNMNAGKEVFDTCVWIGKFQEAIFWHMGREVNYIYRKDEKINICGSMKAKDGDIRRALIDRFAKHDLKNGRGTKKQPDWFYGFKADIWAAYAVAVTFSDMQIREVG